MNALITTIANGEMERFGMKTAMDSANPNPDNAAKSRLPIKPLKLIKSLFQRLKSMQPSWKSLTNQSLCLLRLMMIKTWEKNCGLLIVIWTCAGIL